VSRRGWQSEEEGLCDFWAGSKEQILGGRGGVREMWVTGEHGGGGAGTPSLWLRDFRAVHALVALLRSSIDMHIKLLNTIFTGCRNMKWVQSNYVLLL
jgi:hypothetical protein